MIIGALLAIGIAAGAGYAIDRWALSGKYGPYVSAGVGGLVGAILAVLVWYFWLRAPSPARMEMPAGVQSTEPIVSVGDYISTVRNTSMM